MSEKIEPGCLAAIVEPSFATNVGVEIVRVDSHISPAEILETIAHGMKVEPAFAMTMALLVAHFGIESFWKCLVESNGTEHSIPEQYLRRLPPPDLSDLTRDVGLDVGEPA